MFPLWRVLERREIANTIATRLKMSDLGKFEIGKLNNIIVNLLKDDQNQKLIKKYTLTY